MKTEQHWDVWVAFGDEWDLDDPVGFGKTEADAIADLLEQEQDAEDAGRDGAEASYAVAHTNLEGE